MLDAAEGGHIGGGMKEQLHLDKFTSTKVLRVGHFYYLMSI